MKDLRLKHYFLGMEIYKSKDGIFIYQMKYAKNILKKYGIDNCKQVATPIVELCKDDGEKKVNVTNYKSVVGSLMFLTNNRPNIALLQFNI